MTTRRFAELASNADLEHHIGQAVLVDKDRRRAWRREPAHCVVEDSVGDQPSAEARVKQVVETSELRENAVVKHRYHADDNGPNETNCALKMMDCAIRFGTHHYLNPVKSYFGNNPPHLVQMLKLLVFFRKKIVAFERRHLDKIAI